jgi:hypothetical protein
MISRCAAGAFACAYLLLAAFPAHARLTKLTVESTEAAGRGAALKGHFTGELDPKDPHNALITDIQLAPRNAKGFVEYTATFSLLKPAEPGGVLYYQVANRGTATLGSFPDNRVVVISGWQGDVTPAANKQTITVPIAHNPDGSAITGPVIERLINLTGNTAALNTAPYVALYYQKPATLDTAKATLQKAGKPVAAADWAFADCKSKPFPGTPDPTQICVKNGFDPASEYVVQYTAKDPMVLGIGFAATRDLNSFLRYAEKDDFGNSNPVAGKIKWAIAQGNSQSGNFIRSFINLGFNQDEANRIVWDGANPHIAARQLALNIRFGVPGAAAGPYEPGSEGVLWWADYEDKARGLPKAGLLSRCKTTNTCPKIIETFGSLEFWYLRESPNLVGTDANADIPLPPNVRRYYLPGTTHGGGRGGFTVKPAAPPSGCILPANPNPERETMRALDLALIDWVTKGKEPPASRYPTLAHGDLVPPPNAHPFNTLPDYDFGPGLIAKDLSGVISKEPPTIRKTIPMLVPKTDADGNETSGVPSVLLSAPLGSYLGWNVVSKGVDQGKICGLSGGFTPFPPEKLKAKYATHQGYVDAVKKAADQAVKDGFLLQEDASKLIAEAAASDVLVP